MADELLLLPDVHDASDLANILMVSNDATAYAYNAAGLAPRKHLVTSF